MAKENNVMKLVFGRFIIFHCYQLQIAHKTSEHGSAHKYASGN